MCTVTVFPDSSFRLRISEISISEFEVLFRFSTVLLFSTYDFAFSDFGLSTFIFYFRPLSFLYTSSYSTTSDYYVSKPDFRPPTSTSSILDPFFSVFDSKIPFSTLYSKIFLLKSGRQNLRGDTFYRFSHVASKYDSQLKRATTVYRITGKVPSKIAKFIKRSKKINNVCIYTKIGSSRKKSDIFS